MFLRCFFQSLFIAISTQKVTVMYIEQNYFKYTSLLHISLIKFKYSKFRSTLKEVTCVTYKTWRCFYLYRLMNWWNCHRYSAFTTVSLYLMYYILCSFFFWLRCTSHAWKYSIYFSSVTIFHCTSEPGCRILSSVTEDIGRRRPFYRAFFSTFSTPAFVL